MDLVNQFISTSPAFKIFILTSLIAFITWLVKGLIETPLNQSREIFKNFYEKRINILGKIKTKLYLIQKFTIDLQADEVVKYKEGLQEILEKDENIAFLDKEYYRKILNFSITVDSKLEEVNLLIKETDDFLAEIINKVQDEIKFYFKYSSFNPFKKIVNLSSLILINFLVVFFVLILPIIIVFILYKYLIFQFAIALSVIFLFVYFYFFYWIKKN